MICLEYGAGLSSIFTSFQDQINKACESLKDIINKFNYKDGVILYGNSQGGLSQLMRSFCSN